MHIHVDNPMPIIGLPESIRIVTVNIRYDGRSQAPVPIPPTGTIQNLHRNPSNRWDESPWSERRSRLVDALAVLDPDIIGFQEVLFSQLKDLVVLLGDGYGWVGVGRDDGEMKGEFSSIFFRKSRFHQVDYTTKWLSPTPDIPGSKGWDAGLTRIATFLSLRPVQPTDAHTTSLIHVINTHYDDRGRTSRAQASLIIREEAKKWVDEIERRYGVIGGPVILTGDFNSPPDEEGYKNMISRYPLDTPSLQFIDTYRHLISRKPTLGSTGILPSAPNGLSGTYTGFSRPGDEIDSRIDFIFLGLQDRGSGEEEDIRDIRGDYGVIKHSVIDNLIAGNGDYAGWTGRWSDHRAIFVEIQRLSQR